MIFECGLNSDYGAGVFVVGVCDPFQPDEADSALCNSTEGLAPKSEAVERARIRTMIALSTDDKKSKLVMQAILQKFWPLNSPEPIVPLDETVALRIEDIAIAIDYGNTTTRQVIWKLEKSGLIRLTRRDAFSHLFGLSPRFFVLNSQAENHESQSSGTYNQISDWLKRTPF